MPRFYFPTSAGPTAEADLDGLDIEDVAEARDSAVRALLEMAKEVLDGGSRSCVLSIEVLDEDGRSHFQCRLTFEPSGGEVD